MAEPNKDKLQVQYLDVQKGIDAHVTADITLGGVVYTPAALKAVFANASAAIDRAAASNERWRDDVVAQDKAEAQAKAVYALLRSALLGLYGTDESNQVLGDFGMTLPKPKGAKTVAAKAEGIARRALTRQMRHTMGSEQEKAVKGTIEVPNPALPTSPSTATPAASVVAAPAAMTTTRKAETAPAAATTKEVKTAVT